MVDLKPRFTISSKQAQLLTNGGTLELVINDVQRFEVTGKIGKTGSLRLMLKGTCLDQKCSKTIYFPVTAWQSPTGYQVHQSPSRRCAAHKADNGGGSGRNDYQFL